MGFQGFLEGKVGWIMLIAVSQPCLRIKVIKLMCGFLMLQDDRTPPTVARQCTLMTLNLNPKPLTLCWLPCLQFMLARSNGRDEIARWVDARIEAPAEKGGTLSLLHQAWLCIRLWMDCFRMICGPYSRNTHVSAH